MRQPQAALWGEPWVEGASAGDSSKGPLSVGDAPVGGSLKQAISLADALAVADQGGSSTSAQHGRNAAPLAITCGDPAGVGPELIERILRQPQAALLGDAFVGASSRIKGSSPQAVSAGELASEAGGRFAVIGPSTWLDTLPDFVEKVAVGDSAFRARAGVPSEAGARVALEAMECAAAGCVSGRFLGVVTGPVSKAELAKVGYPFPGQTEFFAARWGLDPSGNAVAEPVMGFVGERLRVVLATWHVPLVEVPRILTEARLTRAVAAAADLGLVGRVAAELAPKDGDSAHIAGAQLPLSGEPPAGLRRADFAAEHSAHAEGSVPESVSSSASREFARIAVCGLNPHAGEGGILGAEERDFLNPILAKLSPRYPGLVPQCLPGDTVFARALRGDFDVVVALYHDQGLAPLKTVDFDTAVNVTLGLPFVRTSPDHGTAFDLAGKGTASARSFANAIRLARDLLGAVPTSSFAGGGKGAPLGAQPFVGGPSIN